MSPEANFLIDHAYTTSRINKKVDASLSYHGISFTEFLIMHHLFNSPLQTMRRIELAECVGITASGVTRLLAPMEKIRIVEKESNPRDARQSLVKLTQAGEQLYKDALVSFEHCSKDVLANLSVKQIDNMANLFGKI